MSIPRNQYLSAAWRDDLFANKVLFCTGGAGTICSMQVRAFVALGGNAYIIGRNAAKTTAAATSIASVRPGSIVIGQGNVDVRDAATLQQAAETCVQKLGGIDFAIAGAAGNFLAPLSQLSSNAFKSVMDIDTLGSFNTAKAVLPYLVESAKRNPNTGEATAETGGRLLFISASFHYRGAPLQAHAMAAKAGVDQISSSVCIEYGPLGVTANVISPGPIAKTEGMERLARMDEESVAVSRANIPSGRWGEVKEIADAMVYLFSDAGSYVNGHVLVVDGGQWRTAGASQGTLFQYPGALMSSAALEGVKSGRNLAGKDQSKL